MKKTAIFLTAFLIAPAIVADTDTAANARARGDFSGRVQSLSMYRDYDQAGTGANSSVGLLLGYTVPVRGFDAAIAYNYAGEVFENNKASMLANDDIHVLNEAWARFDLSAVNLKGTNIVLGRKIINSEVFRADDFRQKARSIEGFHLEIDDLPDTRLIVGHALRMSNWIQSGDKWDFRDFSDGTDGISWAEGTYRGLAETEIALFDAYSWDVANLVGARVRWRNPERGALAGYYRHENEVGNANVHTADAYGISVLKKVGDLTIEPGYFAVRGDNLLFQETTTGINHPLGSSMMIFARQFNGETDTFYLKATTRIAGSAAYLLYNHTRQNDFGIDGQELNFVLKHTFSGNLTAALKGGIAHCDSPDSADQLVTDARLFVTYKF